jgi:ABC-type taurine transport system ATPase subunit
VVLTVSLKLFGKDGVCKFTAEGRNIDTVYNAEYEEGDVWHIDTAKDSFLKLSLDQTLLSSIVYLPTGALDFETGKQILTQLESLSRQYHKTVVIVTHTREIAQMADRVITVKDGKIEKMFVNDKPVSAERIAW